MLIEWIRAGLEKPKKSKAGLARALGIDPAQITRMLGDNPEKRRRIRTDELPTIAAYLEEPMPNFGLIRIARSDYKHFQIAIIGTVAPGVWREPVAGSAYSVHRQYSFFPPDPRYSLDHQFDMLVEGTSIDRLAPQGSLLRCVDIAKSGILPDADDFVIVERHRGDLVEFSARRFFQTPDGAAKLSFDSNDPRWQEALTASRDDLARGGIKIIGVVLYAYTPTRKRV